MHTLKIFFSSCLIVAVLIGLCEAEQSKKGRGVEKIQNITTKQWESLSEKKIFFGHQSVGYNILDGVRILMEKYPNIQLNIEETVKPTSFTGRGIFAHAKIGKNEDPVSKTIDFERLMESGGGDTFDIAFHKYCFIDINNSTDIEKLFQQYKKHMDNLKEKYPNILFVHCTVPLTTIQTGPKAWIKKVIGKPLGGVLANIKRNEFNGLLLSEYASKAPVFDLARAEATKPDGTLASFKKEGKSYLVLFDGYSSDGGHLNPEGEQAVAAKLLVFLAQLP